MANHSSRYFRAHERRIIYVLLAVLLGIQLAAYQINTQANRQIVQSTLQTQLASGDALFHQILSARQSQIAQAATVLAADYGLKEAIASGDRPTIESMLFNHSRRIEADIALLNDLDQRFIASAPGNLEPSVLPALLKASASQPSTHTPSLSTLTSADGALYQLVRTAVKMPTPQAELTLGFAVNDAFAQHLRQLTDTDFVFISRTAQGRWQQHGSSLDAAGLKTLLATQDRLASPDSWLLPTGDDHLLMQAHRLEHTASGHANEVRVIMGKSLNQALAPYRQIERIQFYLIIASVLLSVLAVLCITRRMVAPLNAMAYQDGLTGLANRRFFDQCIRRAASDLSRKRVPFCVMMIDLDQFKQINDRHGHAAGDEVLRITAQRLQAVLRKTDTPARLGGDEFAALLPGADRETAQPIIEKIERALSQPIAFDQQSLRVGISIGLAIAPQDGSDPAVLLKIADKSMYIHKYRPVKAE
ncbi:MAG: diguanylate cyclase [Pseudomonadota bacterium]